ncbi:MAG: hypothetical protein EOP36_01550 [Rubrivivax sp.]|nr:MAG: hypothetical protein EOP36_01550 [Rubrivivax sp.]
MVVVKAGSKRSPKARAPNLTPELITEIVVIIQQWTGRLTWPALVCAIEHSKRVTYTRQTLSKHRPIAAAYDEYRKRPALNQTTIRRRGGSQELQMVLEELDAAKAEVTRLKAENERLCGQFVRWAHNASQRGLTEKYLNQPLPEARQRRELNMEHDR